MNGEILGKKLIPISKTILKDSAIKSVKQVLKSGWLVQGKKVREFENKWSEFTKLKYSCATTSCTSGLLMALNVLNISKGDEVLVPAFTWVSTANVVELSGAKPIFIDISLDDFNINQNLIECKITKKTKAIIVVHLFGAPANMKEINKIANKHNLFVIEDAACGFGSYINDKHVGNFGDIGVFSFHPRKSLTTGEGGMINCKNKTIYKRLKALRDHGAHISDFQRHHSNKPYFLSDHIIAGYNNRMTDIQAAIGVDQLKYAKKILRDRRCIANFYYNELSNLKIFKLPMVAKNNKNGFQSFPCLIFRSFENISDIKKINLIRNKLMEYLYENDISTRPATHSVHLLSFYKNKYNLKRQDFLNSYYANECSISLPIYYGLKLNDAEKVVKFIQLFFKNDK